MSSWLTMFGLSEAMLLDRSIGVTLINEKDKRDEGSVMCVCVF